MPNLNWNLDRTAAQWAEIADAMAQDSKVQEQRKAESFERCDTDGFLSQWASGVTARFDSVAADLARSEGMAEFPALFDLDGNVVSTHRGDGQWGPYWVLNDEAAKLNGGKRFVNESKASKDKTFRANMAKKGYAVGTIACRAYPDYVGASAVCVTAVRKPIIDRLRAGDFQVVSTELAPWMD